MIEIIPNWHPIFVHFTVALLLMSALFYVVSLLLSGQPNTLWLTTARVNLFAGATLTVATVIAGFYAYNSVAHDDPSHAAMTDHRNWAVVTAAVWLVVASWEGWRTWRSKGRSAVVATALIVAAVLLGVTGFKGGELVFRYGLGVASLPNIDSHLHSGEPVAAHPHEDEPAGHGHEAPPAADLPADGQAQAAPGGQPAHREALPSVEPVGGHLHQDGSRHTH